MKLLRLCLALVMLAGIAPTVAAGDEPLTINVILSLTGPAAFAGDQHGLGPDSVVVVKWSPAASAVAAASGTGGKPL